MQWHEFIQHIEIEDQRLKKRYPGLDNDKILLARTVKLAEEMGEIADKIPAFSGLQRSSKLERFEKTELSAEFADLIITAFLLARSAGIDIRAALEAKIVELNNRAD